MQKLRWTRENRDIGTTGVVGARRRDDYYFGIIGKLYSSAFILPTGTEEPIIVFRDDAHAEGFQKLLDFARDCAADGAIRAREALKLLGEEL